MVYRKFCNQLLIGREKITHSLNWDWKTFILAKYRLMGRGKHKKKVDTLTPSYLQVCRFVDQLSTHMTSD